jgi:ABC-type oligopeptide transport system substrate-binding subunit
LAIDRDLLTEKVTQFGEQPSYTLVPPGIMDYVSPLPDWAEWTQEERNTEARRLYAEAGYSEENPLKFEIRYTSGENNKKMALAASSLWKQVLGVQATLLNEEYKVFLQNRERRVLTQVFQAGWISDYADAYSFLNLFRTRHGNNDFGYSNSLYDSLLDEVAAERIPSRRRRLMYETERLLLADTPIIPLYTYVTKRMVNPRLKGWQSNVMDHHYSKDMFFLKAESELLEEISVTGKRDDADTADESDATTEQAEATLPPGSIETVVPAIEGEIEIPVEEDGVDTSEQENIEGSGEEEATEGVPL